jgi:ER membrane protein SH3
MMFCKYVYFARTDIGRWVGPNPSTEAVAAAEAHYILLANAPRIIPVMLHAVIGVGIFGHLVKLYKPNESNYLFDGASLVLYMIAVILYGTSITTGIFLSYESNQSRHRKCQGGRIRRNDKNRYIASHGGFPCYPRCCTYWYCPCTLGVDCTGVLLLQGGQWYAEVAALREMKEMEASEREESKKSQ